MLPHFNETLELCAWRRCACAHCLTGHCFHSLCSGTDLPCAPLSPWSPLLSIWGLEDAASTQRCPRISDFSFWNHFSLRLIERLAQGPSASGDQHQQDNLECFVCGPQETCHVKASQGWSYGAALCSCSHVQKVTCVCGTRQGANHSWK